MKVLTKGIYYYRPSARDRYLEQGLDDKKLDGYINSGLVMVWHECEKWSRRPGINRVSMKCEKETEDTTFYKCAYCDFEYELDNHLKLIESA